MHLTLRLIIVHFLLFFFENSEGQTLYTTNWYDAGLKTPKPTWVKSVNILDFGGDSTGIKTNDSAFNAALASLTGAAGTITFPNGTFLFKNKIDLNRDSILIKGNGYNTTKLIFSLGGTNKNCVQIAGSLLSAQNSLLINTANRDSKSIEVTDATKFSVGDWVQLGMNDSAYFYSPWAFGTLIQVLKIKSIISNTIGFESPIRLNYPISKKPKITKLLPKSSIGIECLHIHRADATTAQTSIIDITKAVNCWVNGVETDSSNFAHIALTGCSNISITNSYFHHAYAYGGGGQGYGIAIQQGTGECKIEANIFERLRHSILFQSAANGNVVAYNYSRDPYWTGTLLPSNSAGDIVLHGNYVYSNLIEGNINQNTVIDDSHGINGPLNTFFRNRSEGYGIFMNTAPATDSVQLVGHEITNPIIGLYSLAGNGRVEHGNKVNGVVSPSGTAIIAPNSLYLPSASALACPTAYPDFPAINYPKTYNKSTIAAKERYLKSKMAICSCAEYPTKIEASIKNESIIIVFPNPFEDYFYLKNNNSETLELSVYNTLGQLIFEKEFRIETKINTQNWFSGFYFLKIKSEKEFVSKIVFKK